MALAFKRSRMDQAHERTFPNAKEEVIFRTDVSNKNLLKNPFRTAGIPVGPVGVQNRPANKLVDNRGALYAESTSVLRKGITNNNLLHNPYRFKVDPTDEPRTLSMQVIKEINDGSAPQYIRENKGIDEIAFMIVKALPDNGVKLATISMLKSYITGLRLQSVLDQGGQNVTKAFDVLNQLVVVCKNLFKTGALGMRLPALLLEYSTNIANVFGDTVLQPVSPMLMFSAIQDLASVSSVLSKLFKSQNAISAPTNVSIDEWARMEAARLQSIREREAKQEIIDNNAPQVKVAGDNQPTGTQGIKDGDTIKQDGTGMRRKKKKLSEMMGGAQIDWGIANPGGQVNPTPNPVNNMPVKDPVVVKLVKDPDTLFDTIKTVAQTAAVVGSAVLGGYNLVNAWKDRGETTRRRAADIADRNYRNDMLFIANQNAQFDRARFEDEGKRHLEAEQRNQREILQERRELDRYNEEVRKRPEEALRRREEERMLAESRAIETERAAREAETELRQIEQARLDKIERLVRPDVVYYRLRDTPYEDIFNIAYRQVINGQPLTLPGGADSPLDAMDISAINQQRTSTQQLKMLSDILLDYRDKRPLNVGRERDNRLRSITEGVASGDLPLDWSAFNDPANRPQRAEGKKRKTQKIVKSKKSKTKKSKNLDAQILALLRA